MKYLSQSDICFGEVQFFLKDCHNDGYAVVRLIDNIGLNVCSSGIDPPRDPVAETFWSSGFLGHHFVAVRFTRRFKLIRCMQIETRVVFVESDEPNIDGYVSQVLKAINMISLYIM